MRESWVIFAILGVLFGAPRMRLEAVWKAPGILRGGGADPLRPERFFTWGDRVLLWEKGRPRELARAGHGFDEGGCVLDADGDGQSDLVLARRSGSGPLGDLVWLRAPRFEMERIDTGVELHNCLPSTQFGRAGFVLLHRNAQVRFYHRERDGNWPLQEIYSIYTASRQSGLTEADVDGDGRMDLYAGNYWVRSPEAFDLPWRIFAIHLHHESDEAASFSYAAFPGLLVGTQRERTSTPVRIFEKPADPRQLWPERTIPGVRINFPRAAARWGEWAVIGHERGVLLADPVTGSTREIPGSAVLCLWPAGERLYLVSEDGVAVWRR